jgi:long-chain acyl-CoA synthetase
MTERPWLKTYPQGVPQTLEPYPQKSLYSILANSAANYPNAPAIAFQGPGAPKGIALTYRELEEQVAKLAGVLASLGVKKGDRVGLILPNCPQYVIAYYACLRMGAVVVGNNPLYTERELSHQLKDAGIEVVIILENLFPTLDKVRDKIGLREIIVTSVTDFMPFPLNLLAPIKMKKDAKKEGHPWPPVPKGVPHKKWKTLMKGTYPASQIVEVDAANDLAGLIYTGGTTGLSKGAMLSHANLLSNVMQGASWFPDLVDGKEGVMCVIPFFHSYGMTVAMNVGIYKAAKLVLELRFELEPTLKSIQREKPTLFPGVPRLYIAINEGKQTSQYDLTSIRACLSGAAPLPIAVAEQFESITGSRVVEGYGLTETSPITHANPIYGERKPGSIGMPVPDTDCKIVDLDDWTKEMPAGESGELILAGPQIMKGYFNRPEETEGMIKTDGDGMRWLLTGDIATMDPDGYFRIVDRKKDMIIVSGFNVYPTDIEQVLYTNPKVSKCVVLGVPDDKTGEAVKAYVVLKEGEQASAAEIIAFLKDGDNGITGYKVPKQVEFRDSLPETLVGKILRRVLLEEEKQKTSQEAEAPAS